MATHDYDIANQSGANFRTDLNNCLDAIVSNNSNSSDPSTTFAYMWWVDTSNNVLKLRNSANNAWITLPMSITASNTITPTLNMGTGAEEDVKIVYDGNAKDFYIALDDSADVLIIGEGSTVGTNAILTITDDSITIGDGAAVDTKIVYNGNAQDFYVGLDDSADDLIIGLGSTVGTTPIMSFDENKDVSINEGKLSTSGGSGADNQGVNITDTTHSKTHKLYGDNSLHIQADSGQSILIKPNASEIARFTSDGLTFNGDTAAANALDDYEKGTWTPTDASGASLSFTVDKNRYTKIGRFVMAHTRITYPSTSNGSTATVALPFTPNSNSIGSVAGGICTEQDFDTSVAVTASIDGTAGTRFRTNGGGALTNAQLSGKTVRFTVTYII